jgi:D-glycero-alpha-D-manno-heptose-7-phosphate kinase
VGLLNALHALQGRMPSKNQLAHEALYVEQTLIGDNVGAQDQAAAAFGGFNRIVFHPNGDLDVHPVILPAERLAAFADHLLLVFTGFQRNATDIAAAQIKATPKKQTELSAMRQMVDEGLRILCGSDDLTEFGKLLHEGWQLKRSLTNAITTPAIDEIYNAARSAGAIGGKLLGAGGGGFALFFARPEQHAAVLQRLEGLTHVPFKLDTSGSQIIVYQPDLQTLPGLRRPAESESQPLAA